jgi:hypothetical protein
MDEEPRVTSVGMVFGMIVGLLLAIAVVSCIARVARAHGDADWIHKGGYKNAEGEWCCGTVDCFAIPAAAVRAGPVGYEIGAAAASADGPVQLIEVIPYSEVQKSIDGQYWRCKRPDGTRRCFFAPPNSF